MQVSATCPPLKCDFVNFFVETPFFLDYQSENRPLKTVSTDLYAVFLSTFSLISDLSKQREKKRPNTDIYIIMYYLEEI